MCHLDSDIRLPLQIEDLTADWFACALSSQCPGIEIADFQIHSVQTGTATKLFVELDFSTPGSSPPPRRLVLKAGFSPHFRRLIPHCYVSEALFYKHIAPHLQGMVPRSWFAGADLSTGQGVILIEDLKTAGARFGTPLQPWSPELVAQTLDLLATWHGRTWNRKGIEGYRWLSVGPTAVRVFTEHNLRREPFERSLSQPYIQSLPRPYRSTDRLLKGLTKLWEIDDSSVLCLSHGDTHVGNTYITRDGEPRFLDWQTVCLGPFMADVAYFIVSAMTIPERRANEKDLIKYYLEALARHGGAIVSHDDVCLDYRRQHLHGLTGWAFLTEANQPLEYIVELTQRYSAAASDHDTLRALGA